MRSLPRPVVVTLTLAGVGASLLSAAWAGVRPPAKPVARKPAPFAAPAPRISYYRQVRPVFQARCQGCHQPGKPLGGYVMTEFGRLLAGGDTKQAAVVPGKPEASRLLALITPKDGKAAMPQGGAPLSPEQVNLVRQWIAQGATDDSPQAARAVVDMEHPPVYTRPPVITSLSYSPDGRLLAAAGYHEVLVLSADGGERVARLVGLAERIESVAFSPDGKRLAVAGGLPGRAGEIQVWDVEAKKLVLSAPLTADTLRGVSWSPDGKLIAFGCADNTVRAIDAATGQQVLQQGSHSDWALGTVFSVDGAHLVSVGRDRTAKLTEVATQRFIDNITSITPGALKGGLEAVARHPQRNEIVAAGADGTPRVYNLFRVSNRVIGDDANLVRELPALRGRVFGVAVSADGKRIAAAASLDGSGEVGIYSYEFDGKIPDRIIAIQSKVVTSRTAEENAAVAAFYKEGARQIAKTTVPAGMYAVAFAPDGKTVAAAGADGLIRLVDPESGAVRGSFSPVPLAKPAAGATAALGAPGRRGEEPIGRETLPPGAKAYALDVQPKSVKLTGRAVYAQLLVSARLTTGETVDVTRMVTTALTAPVVVVSATGLVQPRADGQAQLKVALGNLAASVPITVTGSRAVGQVDFVRDVQPTLSKLGCNSGTCHGSAQGKAGFKLSLRGYDQLYDVRAFTDDLAARRVNIASPDNSLMLLKPTGAVPHVGGALFKAGDPEYEIVRTWIAQGARLNVRAPRVTSISVVPENPVAQRLGSRQQVRVVARYADGASRDVTREAFIETGNADVATANKHGLMTAVRRGEAPILARYEGAYAATTLTVMGDRTGFTWRQPPAYNRVDEFTAAKWKRMKIEPSGLSSDAEFLRRASLDLTGLPPTAEAVRAFLADARPSREKRDALIDRLVGSPEYVEYWTNKWADLLQVNRKFLGVEGAVAFRKWIRDHVEKNTPYDQFARAIVTAGGSNRENPAASYYKILRDPASTMENTTHLFLGVRFNCNKCHDHPFERWTQDQYYHLTAYFARVGLRRDPESGARQVGGTAVEAGKPLYEIVYDMPEGEVMHERTGEVAPAQFPYPVPVEMPKEATRREQLATWLTSPENQYFARSYVNRLWGYLFGVGIIEPIDDIRAGNPATNPELLDYLTQEFIKSGFDVRTMVKLIAKSRTYQLSVATNRWNQDDKTNYSHALARRLPAEVLYDAVHRATGSVSRIPGLAPGTRAAELPDSGVELESGFFGTFGRPPRESACECERTSGLQLGPVMALVSGPTISNAVGDPQNEIAKLVAREPDDRKVVDELFVRILNRPATQREIDATLATLREVDQDHMKLVAALARREAEVAPLRQKAEQDRLAAIETAKAELAAHETAIAPAVAEAERKKQERTAQLEADLKDYEGGLPAKLAEWEKRQNLGVQWVPLDPTRLTPIQGGTLTKQPDLSVVAAGPQKGAYGFVAHTDLRDVTAVRLEVLADPNLPSGGPGRAPEGNFVLTEFELRVAPKSAPAQVTRVLLDNPKADFTQAGFDIRQAVDGNTNSGNTGWAVYPALGISHWAVFEAKTPFGFEGGTVLTFNLHHNFASQTYALGRFRISVAVTPKPIPLGLSEDLKAVVTTPAEMRTPEQQAHLLKYFRVMDDGYQQRVAAIGQSRQPLPLDRKLVELREQLTLVSRPVPEDSRLVQLRADVEASTKQQVDKRLTAAQDLAWALINSPAFLFNY